MSGSRKISEATHRLLTPLELFARYPKAYFNALGELVYDQKKNRYILPGMLYKLGSWSEGFHDELYIERY